MKKLVYFVAAIGMTIFSTLTGCHHDDGLTHITIAEVTHSLFYAPQYIAMEKGFFEEEGLKVDIITTPGADKTMAALLSKEAQIGLMGKSPELERQLKYPLQLLPSIMYSSDFY